MAEEKKPSVSKEPKAEALAEKPIAQFIEVPTQMGVAIQHPDGEVLTLPDQILRNAQEIKIIKEFLGL